MLYSGQNPYIDAIRTNITHLVQVIESGDWSLLRRKPACYLGLAAAVQDIEKLVAAQLATFKGSVIKPDDTLLMPV